MGSREGMSRRGLNSLVLFYGLVCRGQVGFVITVFFYDPPHHTKSQGSIAAGFYRQPSLLISICQKDRNVESIKKMSRLHLTDFTG
jgi:hypothetical protein